MSNPQDHFEPYFEELQDHWSANDQITHVVYEMAGRVSKVKVKAHLQASLASIRKHKVSARTLDKSEAAGKRAEITRDIYACDYMSALAEHSRNLDALERTS